MWHSGARALRLVYGQMFLIATSTGGDDGQDWKRRHYGVTPTGFVPAHTRVRFHLFHTSTLLLT